MRPREVTPRPRSGAEAGRTPCLKGGGQEESLHVRGQGQQPRIPDCHGAVTAKRSYLASKVGGRGAAERRYPASEVRGGDERSYPESEVKSGSREELPHAPVPEARGSSWEEQPTPEARDGGREAQTHVQGAVAARAQEGLEELSLVEGQEGQR